MNVNTMKTAARWLAAAAGAAAVIAAVLGNTIVTDSAAPADTGSHSLAAGPTRTLVFPTETLTITVTPHPRPKADPKPASSPEPS